MWQLVAIIGLQCDVFAQQALQHIGEVLQDEIQIQDRWFE